MSRLLVGLAWLGACDPGAGAPPVDSGATAGSLLSTETVSDQSNADGDLTVSIEVDDETTAFLVTGVSEDENAYFAVDAITAPDGTDVFLDNDWYGDQTLTTSIYATSPVVAAQWPIRREDGPLAPGKWKVALRSTRNESTPVEVTTMTKRDPDFQAGIVDVTIVWADGVQNEPTVAEAVGVAVERWRTIWAEQGITLRETYSESSIDPTLSFGTAGSLGILTQAEAGTGHSLQVILGESVDGDRFLYGVAAGIPGSVAPSEQTFVLVSWLAHAGFDGEFDSYQEKRILGETLAHETGHFMGLPHPVEVGWSTYDALGDTDACGSLSSCQVELGANLMFPYPVCASYTDCEQQGDLTSDQNRVLHQYTATL